MLRKISYIIIILTIGSFACNETFASKYTDSLVAELGKKSGEEKIKYLLFLGDAFSKINKDTALYYLEYAKNESIKTEDQTQIGSIIIQIANLYLNYWERDSAFYYLNECINSNKFCHDYKDECNSYIQLGEFYLQGYSFYDAIINIYKGLMIAEKNNNNILKAKSNFMLSRLFYMLNDFARAIVLIDSAIYFNVKDSISSQQAHYYFAKGTYYKDSYQCLQAIPYYLKSIEIFNKLGYKFEIITLLRHIGDSYDGLNNKDSALYYYNIAISLCLELGEKYYLGDLYTKIGHYYSKKKDHKNELRYNKLALETRASINHRLLIASSLINVGVAFENYKLIDSAYHYYLAGLDYAQNINAKYFIRRAYNKLYLLAKSQNKFSEALFFLEKFGEVKDTIVSQEQNRYFLKVALDYETAKNEKEIQKANLENQKKINNILLVFSIVVGILAIVLFFLYRSKLKLNRNLVIEAEIRKEAEVTSMKNAERYRNLSNNLPIGVYQIDSDGVLLFGNPSLFKILGIEENLIDSAIKFTDYLYDEESIVEYSKRMATNSFISEYSIKNAQGNKVWVRDLGRISSNSNGRTTYEGTIEDISEKIKLIDEIRNAKEKAEEANELKGVILGNLGHEIRTPLNGILGFLTILSSDLSKEQKNLLPPLIRSVHRLERTLNSLVALSEIESKFKSLNLTRTHLPTFIDEYVVVFFNDIIKEKKLGFEIEILDNDTYSNIDIYLLNQVFFNIIDNAIKFTSSGVIYIIVGKTVQDGKSFNYIQIKDTGCGIETDNLSLIFEPFRQESEGLERNYEGLGLGLTISKKMMDVLDGKIIVESQTGVGSSFYLLFEEN
jgi:PAS domain S-box-containing protein